MTKVKVFLICLSVLIFICSAIVCVEMYSLERAFARGIYSDVMDEMQDIGYLDTATKEYYLSKIRELNWIGEGDIFGGTWPRDPSQRARKERKENVFLSFRVQPTIVSQWMNRLIEGEAVFEFKGSRPSEYFESGW